MTPSGKLVPLGYIYVFMKKFGKHRIGRAVLCRIAMYLRSKDGLLIKFN
jgi:hypothetical protein